MSSNDEIQSKLRTAIEAARTGDRDTARRLLEQVISADENNEIAWMWMASVVNTVPERRSCLERVLQINPSNPRAQEALKRLKAAEGEPPTPTAAAAPESSSRARQIIEQQKREQAARQSPARRTAAPRPELPEDRRSGRGGISLLIWLGLIVAVLIVAIVAIPALVQSVQTVPPPVSTQINTALAAAQTGGTAPTAGPTSTPAPTNTSVPLGAVTPLATLPPTFTPTFTPTPSPTPSPTPEPLALEVFELLYSSLNSGTTQPDIYLIKGDGSGESSLITEAAEMALAPNNDSIVFVRDVAGFPQIFVASFGDLQNPTQITQLSGTITASPSWSPDGSRIVFSSNHESDSEEIWVMDADGGNLRQLTDDTGFDRTPRWSPTAAEIVFASERSTPVQSQLFTVTLPGDDSEPTFRQLTVSGNNYAPAWSIDGQSIVYVTDRYGKSDIVITDREGFGSNLVTTSVSTGEHRSPSLSPDGRWVAFVSNLEGGFQTFVVSVDGTALQRITDNPREDQAVIFRPADLRDLR